MRTRTVNALACAAIAMVALGVGIEFGLGWGLIVAGVLGLGPSLAIVFGTYKAATARDLDKISAELDQALEMLKRKRQDEGEEP